MRALLPLIVCLLTITTSFAKPENVICDDGMCKFPEEKQCFLVDDICLTNSDCCSNSCVDGLCTESESKMEMGTECVVTGSECTDSSDCCSNYCLANICIE